METLGWSTKIALVFLVLLSSPSPVENFTTRKTTSACSYTNRTLAGAELYDILCGCFHVSLRVSNEGLVVLAQLQEMFWKSVRKLYSKNVQLEVYHEEGVARTYLGAIKCKKNTTQCQQSFENRFGNSSGLQTLQVHLLCESSIPTGALGPCHECRYVELFYNPQRIHFPPSPRPASAKSTNNEEDITDHVVYVVIVLVVAVVCSITCISFFIYQKRKSKRDELSVECMSAEPLMHVTSSSKSVQEILIVDINPQQLCSKRFREFLKTVPKLSPVCYIDHLDAVNENMYEWAHQKMKTCDFIIVVLTKELTTLFNSEPIDILQLSPYSDIVKYFLSQMNSDIHLNHALRYASVLFQPVEVHESFTKRLANLSFKTVYDLTNFASGPSINNATSSELKKLLLTIGADNCDIKRALHDVTDHV